MSNPETQSQERVESGQVDYRTKLNEINSKIHELIDNNTDNDSSAKESLNKLSSEFLSGFVDNLTDSQKNSLKVNVNKILESHKSEADFQTEYKGLIGLAKALGVNLEGNAEQDEQTEKPEEPKLEFNGKLEGVKKPEEGKEGERKLYSKLNREAPKEGENPSEFYKTTTNIKNQLTDIDKLLNDEKLKDNESLKGLKSKLDDVQTVINNTTPENVKILQQFISENLTGDDKTNFDKASQNSKSKEFDGKFGKGTLVGLNKVLEKTGKYIDSFKDQSNEGAEDLLKDVEVKESIALSEGDISAADLLDGTLPDGAKAEFKGGKGINKGETKPQEVTVVVKDQNNKELGEITIIATVDTTSKKVGLKIKEAGNPTTPTAPETTSTSETTETSTTPTGPLKITINGQAEEHPVVTTDVVKNINTPLYYVNTGNEAASEQNNKVDENGDREYLMQVNNETYKVKLDQNGNLKPLAINYESGAKLLLKNNLSCIAYLQSKIPENLPGNPRIARNPNMEDYVIRSTTDRGVKGLTIEPMTLDGKWVAGSNLGNNLALLNFTNFLRGNKNIDNSKFKNDNPDLKLDNGKLYVRIKKGTRLADNSKSGKWYEVNLSKFGISQDALRNFIKYNNGEHWEDDWDKKDDNKGYVKIQL